MLVRFVLSVQYQFFRVELRRQQLTILSKSTTTLLQTTYYLKYLKYHRERIFVPPTFVCFAFVVYGCYVNDDGNSSSGSNSNRSSVS